MIELLGTPYEGKLTGNVLRNKTIGLGSAGTVNSFLAPLAFLNSLYIDFQAVIVPPYVIGTALDINEQGAPKPEILIRIESLVKKFIILASK